MGASPETQLIDTEWGFHDGRIDCESAFEPVVFCAVARESGKRFSFWGRKEAPRLRRFLQEHADDVFVAHNLIAEAQYLLRLGLPLPARWHDTMVGERWLRNRPNYDSVALVNVLHRMGLPHLAPEEKDELRERILHLRFDPDSLDDRREITRYCFSDCDSTLALYEAQHPKIRPEIMAFYAEYLLGVARMELRGLPLDLETYDRIQQNAPDILQAMREDVNRTHAVYDGSSFRRKAFFGWCHSVGIQWPVSRSEATGKPYLSLDNDVMKSMEGRHPWIALVRQVRKSERQLGKRALTIDRQTQRSYYDTMPFRTHTGRNAPKVFLPAGPKWQRFLVVPESPDHVLVYVDYVAQEIGIAAALSGDQAMREMYLSGDPHMDFAIRAGLAPAGASKKTHGRARALCKTINLGIGYGQGAGSMANRMGVDRAVAAGLLAEHHRLFGAFWDWSDRHTQTAYDRRRIVTPWGWRCKVGPYSNYRSWMNWPMQATGGDIMRATIIYLDRQNVRTLAPLHDGFLLSCRRDQLDDLRDAVNYAFGSAVRDCLGDFPMRWDFAVYPERFEDEDGKPLWDRLQEILQGLKPGTSLAG
jgi:DNA polymerase I-like protein with 3'-5' exonuclease and polymerase domains